MTTVWNSKPPGKLILLLNKYETEYKSKHNSITCLQKTQKYIIRNHRFNNLSKLKQEYLLTH